MVQTVHFGTTANVVQKTPLTVRTTEVSVIDMAVSGVSAIGVGSGDVTCNLVVKLTMNPAIVPLLPLRDAHNSVRLLAMPLVRVTVIEIIPNYAVMAVMGLGHAVLTTIISVL